MINSLVLGASLVWPVLSYFFLKIISSLQWREKEKLKKKYEQWGYKGLILNRASEYEGTFLRPSDNSEASFKIIKVNPVSAIVWAPSVLGLLYLLLPFLGRN